MHPSRRKSQAGGDHSQYKPDRRSRSSSHTTNARQHSLPPAENTSVPDSVRKRPRPEESAHNEVYRQKNTPSNPPSDPAPSWRQLGDSISRESREQAPQQAPGSAVASELSTQQSYPHGPSMNSNVSTEQHPPSSSSTITAAQMAPRPRPPLWPTPIKEVVLQTLQQVFGCQVFSHLLPTITELLHRYNPDMLLEHHFVNIHQVETAIHDEYMRKVDNKSHEHDQHQHGDQHGDQSASPLSTMVGDVVSLNIRFWSEHHTIAFELAKLVQSICVYSLVINTPQQILFDADRICSDPDYLPQQSTHSNHDHAHAHTGSIDHFTYVNGMPVTDLSAITASTVVSTFPYTFTPKSFAELLRHGGSSSGSSHRDHDSDLNEQDPFAALLLRFQTAYQLHLTSLREQENTLLATKSQLVRQLKLLVAQVKLDVEQYNQGQPHRIPPIQVDGQFVHPSVWSSDEQYQSIQQGRSALLKKLKSFLLKVESGVHSIKQRIHFGATFDRHAMARLASWYSLTLPLASYPPQILTSSVLSCVAQPEASTSTSTPQELPTSSSDAGDSQQTSDNSDVVSTSPVEDNHQNSQQTIPHQDAYSQLVEEDADCLSDYLASSQHGLLPDELVDHITQSLSDDRHMVMRWHTAINAVIRQFRDVSQQLSRSYSAMKRNVVDSKHLSSTTTVGLSPTGLLQTKSQPSQTVINDSDDSDDGNDGGNMNGEDITDQYDPTSSQQQYNVIPPDQYKSLRTYRKQLEQLIPRIPSSLDDLSTMENSLRESISLVNTAVTRLLDSASRHHPLTQVIGQSQLLTASEAFYRLQDTIEDVEQTPQPSCPPPPSYLHPLVANRQPALDTDSTHISQPTQQLLQQYHTKQSSLFPQGIRVLDTENIGGSSSSVQDASKDASNEDSGDAADKQRLALLVDIPTPTPTTPIANISDGNALVSTVSGAPAPVNGKELAEIHDPTHNALQVPKCRQFFDVGTLLQIVFSNALYPLSASASNIPSQWLPGDFGIPQQPVCAQIVSSEQDQQDSAKDPTTAGDTTNELSPLIRSITAIGSHYGHSSDGDAGGSSVTAADSLHSRDHDDGSGGGGDGSDGSDLQQPHPTHRNPTIHPQTQINSALISGPRFKAVFAWLRAALLDINPGHTQHTSHSLAEYFPAVGILPAETTWMLIHLQQRSFTRQYRHNMSYLWHLGTVAQAALRLFPSAQPGRGNQTTLQTTSSKSNPSSRNPPANAATAASANQTTSSSDFSNTNIDGGEDMYLQFYLTDLAMLIDRYNAFVKQPTPGPRTYSAQSHSLSSPTSSFGLTPPPPSAPAPAQLHLLEDQLTGNDDIARSLVDVTATGESFTLASLARIPYHPATNMEDGGADIDTQTSTSTSMTSIPSSLTRLLDTIYTDIIHHKSSSNAPGRGILIHSLVSPLRHSLTQNCHTPPASAEFSHPDGIERYVKAMSRGSLQRELYHDIQTTRNTTKQYLEKHSLTTYVASCMIHRWQTQSRTAKKMLTRLIHRLNTAYGGVDTSGGGVSHRKRKRDGMLTTAASQSLSPRVEEVEAQREDAHDSTTNTMDDQMTDEQPLVPLPSSSSASLPVSTTQSGSSSPSSLSLPTTMGSQPTGGKSHSFSVLRQFVARKLNISIDSIIHLYPPAILRIFKPIANQLVSQAQAQALPKDSSSTNSIDRIHSALRYSSYKQPMFPYKYNCNDIVYGYRKLTQTSSSLSLTNQMHDTTVDLGGGGGGGRSALRSKKMPTFLNTKSQSQDLQRLHAFTTTQTPYIVGDFEFAVEKHIVPKLVPKYSPEELKRLEAEHEQKYHQQEQYIQHQYRKNPRMLRSHLQGLQAQHKPFSQVYQTTYQPDYIVILRPRQRSSQDGHHHHHQQQQHEVSMTDYIAAQQGETTSSTSTDVPQQTSDPTGHHHHETHHETSHHRQYNFIRQACHFGGDVPYPTPLFDAGYYDTSPYQYLVQFRDCPCPPPTQERGEVVQSDDKQALDQLFDEKWRIKDQLNDLVQKWSSRQHPSLDLVSASFTRGDAAAHRSTIMTSLSSDGKQSGPLSADARRKQRLEQALNASNASDGSDVPEALLEEFYKDLYQYEQLLQQLQIMTKQYDPHTNAYTRDVIIHPRSSQYRPITTDDAFSKLFLVRDIEGMVLSIPPNTQPISFDHDIPC